MKMILVMLVSTYMSCLLGGCQISNHSFTIHTSAGSRKPKMTVVCRDLHSFALSQGFTPQRYSSTFRFTGRLSPGQKPANFPTDVENGKLPKEGGVAEYIKRLNRTDDPLSVIIGYYPRTQHVYVDISGDHNALTQRTADEFYDGFRQRFAARYGPDNISDDRKSNASH